ncbi:hypothetical protein [Candidatus Clostridium stratigraminis]|uniref:Uncharacterized protein n=1 Tax=Candidatus Clostridium stratigraminis TaxID=3381661 RepID=A0ABW8SYG2_9CLOT
MGSSKMLEELRRSIEIIPRKFTFKIESIEKSIEIKEVNEEMAMYRLRNMYPCGNVKLIGEEFI